MRKEIITIIAGTNRDNAVSLQIAQYYERLLSNGNAETRLIDLKDMPDDFIVSALYQHSGKNDDFNNMRERMLKSDKYVFIVPEYNGSFPGVLKAFIDGLQFPDTFRNKKAALIGLSSGTQGGALALSHLTDILNYCGTSVLALKPKMARIEKNMKNGEITDQLYQELLELQAKQLLEF